MTDIKMAIMKSNPKSTPHKQSQLSEDHKRHRNILRLPLQHRGLDGSDNILGYAAKNVSSDYNFTKLLFTPFPVSVTSASPIFRSSAPPSETPTEIITTSLPSQESSQIPSLSPPLPTPSNIKSCPGVTTSNNSTANDNNTSNNDLVQYISTFSYEIVTPSNANISLAVQSLESEILANVAEGFLSCQDRRRNQMKRSLEDNSAQIVLIDSNPPDEQDLINVECVLDTGITADGDTKCTPMIGLMTFYSACARCTYPEAEILSHIKALSSDESLTREDSLIKQMNFIGIREESDENAVFLSSSKNGESGNTAGIGMSFGFITAVAIVLVVTMSIVYKRRKRKQLQRGVSLSSFDEGALENDLSFHKDDNDRTVNLSELLSIHEEEGAVRVSPVSNTKFHQTWFSL